VQVYFVVVALMLSLLTALKLMPTLLLLAFTFAINAACTPFLILAILTWR
jgi:hypothetical protein